MKAFVNRLREEKGVTLIELLATLSILSLVLGTIYGVVQFGFTAYHKVTVENTLRDEADLVMSTIMNELYLTAPEEVSNRNHSADPTRHLGIRMIRSDGGSSITKELTIDGGQLLVTANGGTPNPLLLESEVSGSIRVEEKSCRPNEKSCASGLIEVQIRVEQTKRGQTYGLDMNSRFGF